MGRTIYSIAVLAMLAATSLTAHSQEPTEASCLAAYEDTLAEINAPKAFSAREKAGDGSTLYVSAEPPGPFIMEGVRGPTVKRRAIDAASESYRECLFSVPLPPNPDGTCPFGTSPVEVTTPSSIVAFDPSQFQELQPITSIEAVPLKPGVKANLLQRSETVTVKPVSPKLQVKPAQPSLKTGPQKPTQKETLRKLELKSQPELKAQPAKPTLQLKPELGAKIIQTEPERQTAQPQVRLDPALVKRLKVSPTLMKAAPNLKVEKFRFEKITPDQIRLREDSGANIKCLRNSTDPTILFQIIQIPKLHMTGGPIKVAFNGGSPGIRFAIYSIAQQWSRNTADPVSGERLIEFDFGDFRADGLIDFHEWSPDDVRYAAHIRISFEASDGYWSFIGIDGADPDVVLPGEPSMNLGGMDGYSALPQDWVKTIFHEFGHALGLEHEHQHPTSVCGDALRLEDDEDYTLTLDDFGMTIKDAEGNRPGVLTYLEHYPNYWSREDAVFNLAQLQEDDGRFTTAFDANSIMRYEFPDDWYKDNAPDQCLPIGNLPSGPSPEDYAAIRIAYQQQLCTDEEICNNGAFGPVASPE